MVSSKKKIKIAVLPGDGIGQDVTRATLPVFVALGVPVSLDFGDVGWAYWCTEGEAIPDRTWALIRESDTVLLGAVTSKPIAEARSERNDSLLSFEREYVSPLIQLRQMLDLYVNVRPCWSMVGDRPFRFCVIRENTEGLYAGFDYHPIPELLHQWIAKKTPWNERLADDISVSLRLQSKQGLLRLFEFAFSYAVAHGFSRVTFADKPNVLRQSSAFARTLFESVAADYPHVTADILNVDAVALWMVRRPEELGVIVAENMFGDILSDVGAGMMGGLGFAPSANLGETACYFEPVHGSAPRVASGTANPSAMFLTIAMLLQHFSYHDAAQTLRKAVQAVVREGILVTYDLGGKASTSAMAAAILERCGR